MMITMMMGRGGDVGRWTLDVGRWNFVFQFLLLPPLRQGPWLTAPVGPVEAPAEAAVAAATVEKVFFFSFRSTDPEVRVRERTYLVRLSLTGLGSV